MLEKLEQELPKEASELLSKAKGFWDKFSKPIMMVGSAIIVLAGGWIIYNKFFKEPKIQNAEKQVFAAEKLFDVMSNTAGFNKDSVNLVLKGDKSQGITGLENIIKKFDGTPAENRAELMAGACYLSLKEYDNAIKYLKNFDGEGANQIAAAAYKLLGDAYHEKKNTSEAFSYYQKAASVLSNKEEGLKPAFLIIAANYADNIGKPKDAIAICQEIKENFPASTQVGSGEVDKLLAKLGVTGN
jgi:tetratricopeptide (TPR) repeat protein